MKNIYNLEIDKLDNSTIKGKVHQANTSIKPDARSVESLPVELHYLPTGAIGDKPSFCLVSLRHYHTLVLSQFSLDLIQKAFKECGYTLTKNK